jgi:flagellar biosynthetic protein FliR
VITFTEQQLLAWITPLIWPFLRALALFTTLPVLGTRTVPMRVRIALAAFVALAAQAALPPPAPTPGSGPAAGRPRCRWTRRWRCSSSRSSW